LLSIVHTIVHTYRTDMVAKLYMPPVHQRVWQAAFGSFRPSWEPSRFISSWQDRREFISCTSATICFIHSDL